MSDLLFFSSLEIRTSWILFVWSLLIVELLWGNYVSLSFTTYPHAF